MMNKTFGALLAGVTLATATIASGAPVLSTDFDNSGVTSGDMTGVVWTENGLTAPTTLGASAAIRSGLTGDGDAEGGYFSPNANVNNSTDVAPAWTATFTITVGGFDVDLTDIVIASAESNNGALLGGGNGTSNINLKINGVGETKLRSDQSGASQSLTFATVTTLSANTSYDLTITVWEGASSGHFESVDSITFNGTVGVPEPASLAMGLAGLTLIAARRRR